MRNAYKILVRELQRKISLGRPRHGWEYDIQMDLRETGCVGVDWILLAQDGVQWRDFFQHGNESSDSVKRGTF
jgi:hypothetical protein